MAISIEQGDDNLLRLLFVRSAWGLGAHGVPPVSGLRDIGFSQLPAGTDPAEADERWAAAWRVAWQRFDVRDRRVRPPDPESRAILDATPDEDLAEVYIGLPSTFWNDGIDQDAYYRWRTIQTYRNEPLAESPERLSLTALIGAWREGLTNILQLPYEGYFAERLNSQYLVVSEVTRYDRELYDRALSTPLIS